MPSVLPDNTHIDDSLAKGVARQIIREALLDIERRNATFDKQVSRLTSLPRKPGKRLKFLTGFFGTLLGNSIICQIRPRGKRNNRSLIFFLDYRRHAQISGEPIILEVMAQQISLLPGDMASMHTGIRISQHVLERIIQRNGARCIKDVLQELTFPILYLFFREQEGDFMIPPGDILHVPSPNGLLICGDGGLQPYEHMTLKTLITFVHESQMTNEQIGEWHFHKSQMPEDIADLFPERPGMGAR